MIVSRVIVVGGAGFVGQHVVRLAAERGHDVSSLSRASGCDVRDADQAEARLSELSPDVVINCAAHVGSLHYVTEFAADVVCDNLMLLVGLYRAVSRACPRALVVNPISNCSYPGAAITQREAEWQAGPVHDSVLAFGSSRRMIYVLGECFRKQYGIRTINWIVPNAYGPGDSTDPNKVHALNGIIIRLIQAQQRGDREFVIWGSGKPIREWAFAPDVARLLVESALDTTKQQQVYPVNVGQNSGYSILEVAQTAARLLGYNVEFTFDASKPDGAPRKVLADTTFREQRPDFVFTPLAEGIRETIEYYRLQL